MGDGHACIFLFINLYTQLYNGAVSGCLAQFTGLLLYVWMLSAA